MYAHTPILVDKVLEYLDIKETDTLVDCTLGEGGHSYHFLQRLTKGKLIGIEQDEVILNRAKERLKKFGERFIPIHSNFSNIKEILTDLGFKRVNKIFFDLGVSMFHIKESKRGFSFLKNEDLDMRLDPSKNISAKDVVNNFDEKKLAKVIWAYGEERFSSRIAHFIVEERKIKPITTSLQLSDIIKRAIPKKFWPKRIHPATKTFQAIRIFVNDEIEILENALRDAVKLLEPEGRVCVISFHSLEDRIVKSVFGDLAKGCICPPDFPVCICGRKKEIKVLTRKPVLSDEKEVRENPSSRSAKLRCAEKLSDAQEQTNFSEKVIA